MYKHVQLKKDNYCNFLTFINYIAKNIRSVTTFITIALKICQGITWEKFIP